MAFCFANLGKTTPAGDEEHRFALGLQLPFPGRACKDRRLIACVRPTLQMSDPTTSARCPTARRKCGWGWDGGEGIL